MKRTCVRLIVRAKRAHGRLPDKADAGLNYTIGTYRGGPDMSWMTQADAAAALRCSIRTVRRRIRNGSLPAQREGRNIYVNVEPEDSESAVSALARRWPDLQGPRDIRPAECTDHPAAVAGTVKEALATLTECRGTLEREIGRVRRSRRANWLIMSALVAAVGGLAWAYHDRSVAHGAQLRDVERTLAKSEADAGERLAAVEAHGRGQVDALWTSLTLERARSEDLNVRNDALAEQFAVAAHERDLIGAERRELEERVRTAERTANLAKTVGAFLTAAQVAVERLNSNVQVRHYVQESRRQDAQRLRELNDARRDLETGLASATGRYQGEVGALRASLEHERKTVVHLEQRLDALADKLVEVTAERGRAKLERVRLATEVKRLNDELELARRAGAPALAASEADDAGTP